MKTFFQRIKLQTKNSQVTVPTVLWGKTFVERSTEDNSVSSVEICSEKLLTSIKDSGGTETRRNRVTKHVCFHYYLFHVSIPVRSAVESRVTGNFEIAGSGSWSSALSAFLLYVFSVVSADLSMTSIVAIT